MRIKHRHSWDVSIQDAVKIQKKLRNMVELRPLPKDIKTVAGADVSSSKKSDRVWAGVVVPEYPRLIKLEEKWVRGMRKLEES